MAAQNAKFFETDRFQAAGEMPINTLKRHPKNIDLTKTELLKLLSCLEGELQARDVSIAALKAEKSKQLLYQAKYGRFKLGDPFHAMQRDSDCQKDNSFDEAAVKAMYDNQLMQLENLIETQRKAQIRMREQLVAVEKRYHKVCAELEEEKKRHAQDTEDGDNVTCMLEKERERLKQELEFEKAQKKKLEKELKKTSSAALSESGDQQSSDRHKHIAIMLIADRKKINDQMSKLKLRNTQLEQVLKDEQAKTKEMAEALSLEGQKSHHMEASLEKHLSDFDTEREQLKLKLSKEETKTKELTAEHDKFKFTIEQLQRQIQNIDNKRSLDGPKSVEIQNVGDRNLDRIVGSSHIDKTSNSAANSHTDRILSPRVSSMSAAGKTLSSSPSRLAASKTPQTSGPQERQDTSTTRKVPVVHLGSDGTPKSGISASAHKPGVDPSSSVKRSIMQFDTDDPSTATGATPVSPGGKPIPAEKPAELQSPRVLNASTAGPPLSNTSVLTVSGRTTVFTTPSGTRISLNVGPSSEPASGSISSGSAAAAKKVQPPVAAVRESKLPPPIPSKPPALQSSSQPAPPSSTPPATHSMLAARKSDTPGLTPVARQVGSVQLPVHHQTGKLGSPRYGTPGYGSPRSVGSSGQMGNEAGIRKPPPPQSANLVQNSSGSLVSGSHEQAEMTPQARDVSHDTGLEFLGPEMEDLQQLLVSMASESDQQSSSSYDSDVDSIPTKDGSPTEPQDVPKPKQTPLVDKPIPPHIAAIRQYIKDSDWSGLKAFAANQRGVDLNEPIDHENTVVHYVTQSGNLDCLNVLLSMGADANAQNCDGLTPLHIATGSGLPECCALLLQYGAHVTVTNKDGQSSLHMAVKGGSTDVVQTILDHCVRNSTTRFGETLYMTDSEGCSALFLAAMRDSVDMLRILSRYCELDAVGLDKSGRTIIDVASPVCKAFLKTIEDKPKINCQVVIENPANPNTKTDSSGNTHYIIGDIIVPMDTSWQQLEESLGNLAIGHFNAVATGVRCKRGKGETEEQVSLGLTIKSVKYFGIGKYFWSPGTTSEKLPHDLLYNNPTKQVSLRLFGLDEGCLDSLTYESLISTSELQNYMRLIEQYKSVLFYGAFGTGKTFICRKLAQVIQSKEGQLGHVSEITFVTVHDKFTHVDLNSVLNRSGCLLGSSHMMGKNFTPIVILDGLHKVSVAETFKDLLPIMENRGPQHCVPLSIDNKTTQAYYLHTNCFILGSMDKNRLPVLDMTVQQSFRWVHLRNDQEPLRGLLQRHFYRQMISQHGGNISAVEEVTEKTIEWVVSVWQRLNEGLLKLGLVDHVLGPNLFLECPIEENNTAKILDWLKALWNDKIAPAVSAGVLRGAVAGADSTGGGGQKVANTALYVLMQRAVVSGCPLSGHEKDKYLSDFVGSNELDIKMKKERSSRPSSAKGSRTTDTKPADNLALSSSQSGSLSVLNATEGTNTHAQTSSGLQQSRSLGNMSSNQQFSTIASNNNNTSKMIPINSVVPSVRKLNSTEAPKSFGSNIFALSGIPTRPEATKAAVVTANSDQPKTLNSKISATAMSSGMHSPKLPRSGIPSPKLVGSGISSSYSSRSILASSPLPKSATEESGRSSANQSPVFRQQYFTLPSSASSGNIPFGNGTPQNGNGTNQQNNTGSLQYPQPGTISPINPLRADLSVYQSSTITHRQTVLQTKTGIALKTSDASSLRRAFSPTSAAANIDPQAVRASGYRRSFSPSPDKTVSGLSLPKKS